MKMNCLIAGLERAPKFVRFFMKSLLEQETIAQRDKW